MGPGLITGAADDDPAGVSTYAIAGASFGYSTLWVALLTLPLMAAVQLMCARLGAATGHGLAHEIRLRYPRWVLWMTCALLAVANVTNLGADLGGMAEAAGMVTGISPVVLTPAFAASIVALLLWSSYRSIARIFKWLTLVLFAYVFAAFLAHPDWRAILQATFVPRLIFSKDYLMVLVAVLGTTISPYLFVWQAAQEVEEHRGEVRTKGVIPRGLHTDTIVGMGYSNAIMYFIILATGATLHVHGKTHVETARQAAEALLPVAGHAAYLFFALGLIGTGMLGVPVLAGSCGYAFAEAAAWRGQLDAPPRRAPYFYAVIVAAAAAGLVLNFSGMSAVRMMFLSAVINGVLAPPLILLVILLTSSRRVMGTAVSSPALRGLGWATFVFMTVAAVAMLVA